MHDFITPNAESLERLRAFISKLTEIDLRVSTPAGWTVAGVLAHLAFWDRRAVVLLRRWKESGFSPSPADADPINDATKDLCLALDPRLAADLCLAAAHEVNQALSTLSPDLIDAIRASEDSIDLNRWEHRNEHLDELETVLVQFRLAR